MDVPDDLGRALLAALRNEPVRPPQASSFGELIGLVQRLGDATRHLTVVKELAMSRADASGGYSNRRALGEAAWMSPSQLGRVLEGHGLPRDRRSGGVDLVVAFRAAGDEALHPHGELDVEGLPAFTLPPALSTLTPGPEEFADRALTFYYRPQVPIGRADLGRSAGYTLRHPEQDLIACVTEPVFDALVGDPRLDPTRSNGR
ncbi:hypothetical protein ACWCYY_34815 [Kitasatospora sp. NPDC001664]